MTAGLSAAPDYQASCISGHSMSRAMWQLKATFASSPARKERHQAHTTRRATHRCTHCPLESHWRTQFRLPTKLRLHSPTLDSLSSPFPIPLPNCGLKSLTVSSFFRNYVQGEERTLLEDISREKEGADAKINEGLKASPTGSVTGPFCIRKKKSSPCGPHFPGTFHSIVHVSDNSRSPSSSNNHRYFFSSITSSNVLVALVTSIFFSGIGKDASLGTYSLTLGST